MSRWSSGKVYFWQEAPFFRPFLFFVAGIICYDCNWISGQNRGPVLAMLIMTAICIVVLAFIRRCSRWMEIAYTIAFCFFFSGLGWFGYASAMPDSGDGSAHLKSDSNALTLVHVKEQPQTRATTTKLVVEGIAMVEEGQTRPVSGTALIYIYRQDSAAIFSENDTLLVPSGWREIRNRGNPFELNTAAAQRRKGILVQQSLPQDAVQIVGKAAAGNNNFLNNVHSWCDRQLIAYIPDSATLGLLQAMLLGDESGFDPELRQAYSQTGVIHIVSISGSHVAVLYLVVTGLLFWLKGKHGKWAKFIVSLALVWLYVLIAGNPPSALRSALMFTVLALCTISGREGNSINTLSSAALTLLLWQPAWLFSVGFQLSFGAVLSIMIFYQPIYRLWYWPKKMKIGKAAWQAIAASLAAEVLTAPLVIFYFHNFPLMFIFANLLAAILAGICALVGGMAIIALCWIPPLARLLGLIVTVLVHAFNSCIVWMQGLNVHALERLHINATELLLVYLLILMLSLLWLRRLKTLPLALAIACALIAVLTYDQYKALQQERLIVYSNGRETAVDITHGKYYQTVIGRGEDYNEKAAHIGYHAWHADPAKPPPYFCIHGQRIFVLSDSTQQSFSNPLAVDVLVLARPLHLLRVAEVLRAFAPKEVVLAVRPSKYHRQRWQDSCSAHGITLFDVAENGAYILE